MASTSSNIPEFLRSKRTTLKPVDNIQRSVSPGTSMIDPIEIANSSRFKRKISKDSDEIQPECMN